MLGKRPVRSFTGMGGQIVFARVSGIRPLFFVSPIKPVKPRSTISFRDSFSSAEGGAAIRFDIPVMVTSAFALIVTKYPSDRIRSFSTSILTFTSRLFEFPTFVSNVVVHVARARFVFAKKKIRFFPRSLSRWTNS